MIVFIDQDGNIRDVEDNRTGISSLQRVEILDEDNPFKGWSKAKICAYKCQVTDGHVTMMTPRIDSRLLEHINQMSEETEINTANIDYIAMETGVDLDQEEDELTPEPEPEEVPSSEESEENQESEASDIEE